MVKKILIITTLLGLFLAACGQSEPLYGTAYNPERQKLSLPIIPGNWQPALVDDNESTWINPDRNNRLNKHLPVHWSKYLSYPDGILTFETDTYYGVQEYTTPDGTFTEHLVITYCYAVNGSDPKWEAYLIKQGGAFDLTLAEAEKILDGWGIQRLTDASTQPRSRPD